MTEPVVPLVGEEATLELAVGKRPAEPLVLRLYTNDHTPGRFDLVSDFMEADAAFGYEEAMLDPAAWRVENGEPRMIVHPLVTFAFTGSAGDVYGWYLVGAVTGEVRAAQALERPFAAVSNSRLEITPQIAYAAGAQVASPLVG